ncbi:MAG: hypothetical protein MR927_04940 [Campylobacter sp.]|uniref:hypothetical protein n=1 Tax=Campylobacter sp. TaxID=205 RepID=UPI002A759E86|nr:hypothetical protein [Campylobacter sp.]MCI7103523.1 hypothetical protein [Campylobacter sp.]MCI7586402.1 hypothetical protein [Campylobacter sp.]MDY3246097.1 hypothetical protein [Campylobacter sp.]MDY5466482.1 hypothetical protein [Campylobacter sp.]
MILFSHPLVRSKTPKISDFNIFGSSQNDEFVLVKNKIQAVISNARGVKFVVCNNLSLAKELQSVADDYLFDSKIALIVKSYEELSLAIDARIDAVICKNF